MMNKISLSKRYKIGKISLLILIIICALFLAFVLLSLVFKFDIGFDKEDYISCGIAMPLLIGIFLYVLGLCYDDISFDKARHEISMTNFFKRRKTIKVDFGGIVAKVYVSKSKGTSKYSVDLWLFDIKFLAKIVVEDDDYKGVLEEAGISNIIVI